MGKYGMMVMLVVGCCCLAMPSLAVAHEVCCEPCCDPCCAPPPPAQTVLCLQDPCTCCTYEVCVCLPACCCGEQPCVTWRNGIFGRRVAILCWECCGHSAKVVVTRRGRVIVRG